jgi:hypothetical protein
MTVTSPRSALVDVGRSATVALLAVVQLVVSVRGALGGSVATVASDFATPLSASAWTYTLWAPLSLCFVAYAIYQMLPAQRVREAHRRTGWWLAASAAFGAGWILAFGGSVLPLAELMIVALLVTLAVAFGRLSRIPATDVPERVAFRGPVALYTGWVSVFVMIATGATGVWVGLPGDNTLAAIAAIVVLMATTGIVAWVVISGTAVVAYAAAVLLALAAIALNDPPAAVVVAVAVAMVLVIAATARRLATAGSVARAAWG